MKILANEKWLQRKINNGEISTVDIDTSSMSSVDVKTDIIGKFTGTPIKIDNTIETYRFERKE